MGVKGLSTESPFKPHGAARRVLKQVLVAVLLITAAACAHTRAAVEEWPGRIVEIDREQAYVVVRSRDRLIDHVFRITPDTKIMSQASGPLALEAGQRVTVEYRRDGPQSGPPAALRIVVVE